MLRKFLNDRVLNQYKKNQQEIDNLYFSFKDIQLEDIKNKILEIKASKDYAKAKINKAIALAKIASEKVLKMSYYDVQIMGGLTLIDGKIAQMKTGEGKTLMCSVAVAANFVLGQKTHVATANEYLAQRDQLTLKPLFDALGISSSFNGNSMTSEMKKAAYNCDVVYSTAQEMGFDYLRDNLLKNMEQRVQPLNFSEISIIIDEADFILIDEARTPLIISGLANSMSPDFYHRIRNIAKKLIKMPNPPEKSKIQIGEYITPPGDFWVDDTKKEAYLSEEGYTHLEKILLEEKIINHDKNELYDSKNLWLLHEITNALKAEYLYIKDKQYVVQNDEIVIVDENTGRLSHGRSWSEGLHQAIEAKEMMNINPLTATLGKVSIQNYCKNYAKLSGMTGTAMESAIEFEQIYNTAVVDIPTNKPMIRKDLSDMVFINQEGKYNSMIELIKEKHQKLQPLLIGTTSVFESEYISQLLTKEKILHHVLNAKNHAYEAQIISQAGLPGAVTVSTSMAGRGTDIILGGNIEKFEQIKFSQIDKITDILSSLEHHEHDKEKLIDENIIKGIIGQLSNQSMIDLEKLLNDEVFNEDIYYVSQPHKEDVKTNLNALKKKINEEIKELETNFKLNKEIVLKSGGLCVIGASRNESRRIDDQLRGRAGRQGDIGESIFFVSFDDSWLQSLKSSPVFMLLQKNVDASQSISSGMVSRSIEKAQRGIDGLFFEGRKAMYQYDSVLDESRRAFFKLRDSFAQDNLKTKSILLSGISKRLQLLKDTIYIETQYQNGKLISEMLDTLTTANTNENEEQKDLKRQQLIDIIENILSIDKMNCVKIASIFEIHQIFEEINLKKIHDESTLVDFFEKALNQFFSSMTDDLWFWLNEQGFDLLDAEWIYYLELTEEIRKWIGFTQLSQKNPLYEYKKECFNIFESMIMNFDKNILNKFLNIFNIERK